MLINELKRIKNCGMIGILPTLRAGLLDSFKPGVFVTGIFFAAILYALVKRGYRIGFIGFSFLWGLTGATMLINIGVVDVFLNSRFFEIVLDVFYFISVIVLLVGGALLLKDWAFYRYFKSEDKLTFKFALLSSPVNFTARFRGYFMMGNLGVVLGMVTGLFLAAWPSDAYVYLLINHASMSGQVIEGQLYILLYTVTSLVVFFIIWIMMRLIVNSNEMRRKFRQSLSFLQIVLAALMLGSGIALLTYYI